MIIDFIKCSKCGLLLESVTGESLEVPEATMLVNPCPTCIRNAYLEGFNDDGYDDHEWDNDEADDWEEDDDYDYDEDDDEEVGEEVS
jgi:hypothetical protein